MNTKKSEKMEPHEEIKRLIILGLMRLGVTGRDIAKVLEVDPASVSRMLSGAGKKDEK